MKYAEKSSKAIRGLAEEQHLSIRQLAERIGVAQTTLNAALASKKGVPVDTLIKIADYFKTTVPELCGMSETKNTPPTSSEGVSEDGMRVAVAYDEAEPAIQQSVRKLLDVQEESVLKSSRAG